MAWKGPGKISIAYNEFFSCGFVVFDASLLHYAHGQNLQDLPDVIE